MTASSGSAVSVTSLWPYRPLMKSNNRRVEVES